MKTIHTVHKSYRLTSDDILRACENYASVVNDKGDYFGKKMPFDRFVEHPKFLDFLPTAFVKGNWKKWGADIKTEQQKEGEGVIEWFEVCPGCKAQRVKWSNDKQVYECLSCGKTYPWSFYNGAVAGVGA